jgi:hypothetical protein
MRQPLFGKRHFVRCDEHRRADVEGRTVARDRARPSGRIPRASATAWRRTIVEDLRPVTRTRSGGTPCSVSASDRCASFQTIT